MYGAIFGKAWPNRMKSGPCARKTYATNKPKHLFRIFFYMFLHGAKFVRVDGNHEDIDEIAKEMVEEVYKVDPKARVHFLPALPHVVKVFCPEEKPDNFGVHIGWLSIPLRWEDYTPGFFYDVGIQPSRGIVVVPSKPWTAAYLNNQSSGFLVSLRELDWERAKEIVPLDLLLEESIAALNELKSRKEERVRPQPKEATERQMMAQEEALQRSVRSHQDAVRTFEAERKGMREALQKMKQAVDSNVKRESQSSKKMYSLQADVERYKAFNDQCRANAQRCKEAAERFQKELCDRSDALAANERTILALRAEIATMKKRWGEVDRLREEVKQAEEEKTDCKVTIEQLRKELVQRTNTKKKPKKKNRSVEHNFDVERYVKEQENRAYDAEMRLKTLGDLVKEFKARMKQTKEASDDLCRRVGLVPSKTSLLDVRRVSETIHRALDTVNRIAGNEVSKKTLDQMVKMYRARKEGKRPLTMMNLHELVATLKWNFMNGAEEYASKADVLYSMSKALKQANKCIRMDIAKHVASERFLDCRMDMDTHRLCTNVIEWCRFVEENSPANPHEHSTFLDEIVTVCCIPIRRASNVIHGVVRNHVNVVTIQRYVRRWLFGRTNYRHFSMRRHTEMIMLGVMKEVITDRPLIEPCVRVCGLIDAGLVSRETAPYILDESKGMDSPYWKLRFYLQTAVEDRMNTFANTIFKTHQKDWPNRIVAGVYVPKGDPEKVVEFLVHHGKESSAPMELARRWGIDEGEAAHMVTRYLSTEKEIVNPGQSNFELPTFNSKWTMSG